MYHYVKLTCLLTDILYSGFPRWLSGKQSTCQCRRHKRPEFDLCVRKIPWRRKWQPTLIFLPGKSHRGAWQFTVHGVIKNQTRLNTHTLYSTLWLPCPLLIEGWAHVCFLTTISPPNRTLSETQQPLNIYWSVFASEHELTNFSPFGAMILSSKRLRKKRPWRKLSIYKSRSYCWKRSKWSNKAHTSVGIRMQFSSQMHISELPCYNLQ